MSNKLSENRAVSEIMWKNAVEPDMRHGDIKWRRKDAVCMPDK
jgi:hypothetical protein